MNLGSLGRAVVSRTQLLLGQRCLPMLLLLLLLPWHMQVSIHTKASTHPEPMRDSQLYKDNLPFYYKFVIFGVVH